MDSTLKFKTNINCGGCIAKVTPFLEDADGVCQWEVDITNKDKILTVQVEGMTEAEVIAVVKEAGFKAETINLEEQ